jgi:hypothetical protein
MHSGTPSLFKPLAAVPFILFVVMALVLVLPSGRLNNPVLEVRNCAADVRPMTVADIAQSGKSRAADLSGETIIPELIAQRDKVHAEKAAKPSFIQFARCAQSQV